VKVDADIEKYRAGASFTKWEWWCCWNPWKGGQEVFVLYYSSSIPYLRMILLYLFYLRGLPRRRNNCIFL
jgi:hypothetical protein